MLFRFYATLTFLGAALPYYLLIQFGVEHQWSLVSLWNAVTANSAVLAFNLDLVISSIAFLTFVFLDTDLKNNKKVVLLVFNFTIGLSCSLPLYLAMKERQKKDTYQRKETSVTEST
jgi:hypothetical protein